MNERSLAASIADALGFEYELLPEPERGRAYAEVGRISGPDGSQLYLSRCQHTDGRIVVSGTYPRFVDKYEELHDFSPHYGDSSKLPRITCAASRGAVAIAADIKRRFLSAYLTVWYEKLEIMLETQETLGRKWAAYELLCSAHERLTVNGRGDELNLSGYAEDLPNGKLKVSTYKGLSVSLELRDLTVEQAEVLISWLP